VPTIEVAGTEERARQETSISYTRSGLGGGTVKPSQCSPERGGRSVGGNIRKKTPLKRRKKMESGREIRRTHWEKWEGEMNTQP